MKALEGAAVLAGAFALNAFLFVSTAGAATPLLMALDLALYTSSAGMIAGGIADALTNNRGSNITIRQPACSRQIVYGTQRVGGNIVYASTTGGSKNQYNRIIVIAGHPCDAIVDLFLDGRKVFWDPTHFGYSVSASGFGFGGAADSNNHIGPGGLHYNFGGLVYCEARLGTQADGDVIGAMTANDPAWAASGGQSPYLGGCTYVYLKVEFNTNMFPSEPEIKFTVRGKNDIFDPRTGTTGYTSNSALIQADIITNNEFGLGDNSVNQDQLIAAANVCDELVNLAAGGTEARYSCNFHGDTSQTPGDLLKQSLTSSGGRISRIGGEWYLFPAYWQGPSATFDANSLIGKVQWSDYRSFRDLVNRVYGTYTASNYPYNVAGDLYDSNGYWDGTTENTFPFAFQPTSYPQYACDATHGFTSDAFLAADNGKLLPRELNCNSVLSVAQAQRLAKIELLRNRQQGTGTLKMSLAAWIMQPMDVMYFNFPEKGWVNKVLEVVSLSFSMEKGQGDVLYPVLQVGVQETDQSVYEWNPSTDELTVYEVPAGGLSAAPYTPNAPTDLTIVSNSTTAVTGTDGVVIPRILATWTPGNDASTVSTQIQYQQSPSSSWVDCGTVDEATTFFYIAGVVAGDSYLVRVRGIRSSGATSDWTISGSLTIPSGVTSQINSLGIAPNLLVSTNNATLNSVVSGSNATLQIYGSGGTGSSFTSTSGTAVSTLPSASLTGLTQATTYYIVWDTASSSYMTFTNYSDTFTSDYYIYIGAVTTVNSVGSGGVYTPGGRYIR
jgi:hypothetical protein